MSVLPEYQTESSCISQLKETLLKDGAPRMEMGLGAFLNLTTVLTRTSYELGLPCLSKLEPFFYSLNSSHKQPRDSFASTTGPLHLLSSSWSQLSHHHHTKPFSDLTV
jgi:hypothetical protein